MVIAPVLLILKFSSELLNLFEVIVHPPIVPPVNRTLEPLTSPLGVTWKSEDDMKKSAEAFPSKLKDVPCCNFVPLIWNPAILPAVAVTVPDIETADAVICPFDFNLSLLLEEAISVELILKLAIVPAEFAVIVLAVMSPVIFALDAVITPAAPLSINVPAVDVNSSPIVKPPIVPPAAVISPLIVTLPSAVKWKLEELISTFPLLPLTNWLLFLPKKNVGVSNVILLPLAFSFLVLISTLLPSYFTNSFEPSPT